MIGQLKSRSGVLNPILQAVKADPDLELEIRVRYLDIYYRGGLLMEVIEAKADPPTYRARIDKRYIPQNADNPWKTPPTKKEGAVHKRLDKSGLLGRTTIRTQEDAEKHAASFADRKAAMDANKKRRPKWERETQQGMVPANGGRSSEYVICDVEYSIEHSHPTPPPETKTSFIDLVAAHRPDRGKTGAPARLALVELKYGLGAIRGAVAGLRQHVDDLKELVGDKTAMRTIAEEAVRMTREKKDLGIAKVAVESFDTKSPVEYIIAVANYNPRSRLLRDALLGRPGSNDGRLIQPKGVKIMVAMLEDDLVLRADKMLALDDLAEGDMPRAIFYRGPRE